MSGGREHQEPRSAPPERAQAEHDSTTEVVDPPVGWLSLAMSAGAQREGAPPPLGTIVDDESPVQPGQVRRMTFWAALEPEVERAAAEELARVGRSSRDCPYLRHWLTYYRHQSAAHLERAIQRYARPESPDPDSLRQAVVARIRAGIRAWAANPASPGFASELATASPHAINGEQRRSPAPTVQRAASTNSSDVPHTTTDVASVRSRLRDGEPLSSGLRSRMEAGFGRTFGDVRLHRHAPAANIATELSARAFTVGSDIAIHPDHYRPGTIRGDLLIAHELAHVLQQRNEPAQIPEAASRPRAEHAALEGEADLAAARVVARTAPSREVESAAQRALGRRYGDALAALDRGTMRPGAASGLRLQRCDILDPEPPELQTQWDESEPEPPQPAPPTQPATPAPPQRTPEEDARARAAESTFAINQVWSILSGIDNVGAEVELFFYTSEGAITMVSWRRSAQGTDTRGRTITADAFNRRLERFLPTFVGESTRYVKLTFRREQARWQIESWETQAPADAPSTPPEGRTLPIDVSGYDTEAYQGIVDVADELHPLLLTPRNGSGEVIATVDLEDDRVASWSPRSGTRTGGDSGGATVAAPRSFRTNIVNALLPFTTGVGSRSVRITLRGTHDGSEPASRWSVQEASVVRPPAPSSDEASEIVAEYRRRHQEIIRRWREGVRDVAVYAAMIGAREIALWIVTGAIFRVAGLGLRAVAPRVVSMFSRGATPAATGWLETLITRMAPAERSALRRLMTKVETQGAEALTAAERAELQRLFRLLDDLVDAPLTQAQKGYLRTAMQGRYAASHQAAVQAFSAAGRAYQIHHRLPLEYAHLFPRVDINAGANLIALDTTVHRGVNAVWTRFRTAPSSAITPARVRQVADVVDRHFGHWYHQVPPTAGLASTVEAAKNAARAEVDVLLAAL